MDIFHFGYIRILVYKANRCCIQYQNWRGGLSTQHTYSMGGLPPHDAPSNNKMHAVKL
jgi:hypothetical protein